MGTIDAAPLLSLINSGEPRYPSLAMLLLQHAVQHLFTVVGGILYLTGGFDTMRLARPQTGSPQQPMSAPPQNDAEETRSILDQFSSLVGPKARAGNEVHLSIVIPAYNEQARLPRTILETVRWCTSRRLDFELIIIDDGSRDQTLALVRRFEETDPRVRTIACPHRGKGAAVRVGMLNAKGRVILFMDADGATPLNEIPKLVQALANGHDVAIGSRVVQEPREVEIKTSFHRRIIGRGFAFLANVFASGDIGDTQCGFKMFRREAAVAIFSRQKTMGFAFDVEILFIARRLSLSIAEIPVNWVSQPGSKVNLVRDSIGMLWDISQIRWLHRKL
jgi:dolichyl-phosphate beta-glucosyltransferase